MWLMDIAVRHAIKPGLPRDFRKVAAAGLNDQWALFCGFA